MFLDGDYRSEVMKHQIKHRCTNAVLYEVEIPDDTPSRIVVRVAMEKATRDGAYLYGADLSGANLSGADLSGADLSGAYLSRADLSGANLYGAKNADAAIAQTRILPEGQLIGWKKCADGVIVKLSIPADAKRSHAFGRKCRAEFADVIEVFGASFGLSNYDRKTKYEAGKRLIPDSFDENWQEECSSGIHFFITRIEAENY